MKCRNVRRLLPLMVGDDLPESKRLAITAHLEKCPGCKQEYDTYMASYKAARTWLDRERLEWNDFEWQRVVRTACQESTPEKRPQVLGFFKRGWAYASLVGVVVLLCLLIFPPRFLREAPGLTPGAASVREIQPLESLSHPPAQEIVAVRLVSQKTGVKIHWFLNKNFNMEEIQ